ncbi:thiamine pyrophosphate-dependent enzyme [Wenxinia saemankumensis]|uniref:Acetolactate synthase-1/2/3 large subunit n=1 Tax=Wenxinia saemankumensis TaxID=1447782 RepID=A0A1M6FH99_9RHOB|nr:thiamine pyrophosphate-dependent enzyme [Wenxinia saemankumensis]SHI96982.1 acetolactate synthase-1/2/3 large subunit [Wenxinia saemankumensis]
MPHGGQVLIESLINLGGRKAFGVPGESFLAALDAMHDSRGRLDFVLCRQEGGAAFMAAAWGKLTGEPGLCFVTRGPGATNASIGIHTAMQDSAPMLVFVGQVATDQKGREAFQELDYRAVFGTMAKWAVEIDDPARLPEILLRAWTTATTGRPGPVVVALPEDMLSAPCPAAPLTGAARIAPPAPDAAALAEAQALMAEAERPLVLVAGAPWLGDAQAALLRFAEASDIPVVAAFRYQDQVDNASPCYAGEAGVGMPPHVARLIREADTILALGLRFGEMTTGAWSLLDVPEPRQRVIHVHASDREIGKVYRPALALHADPAAVARALTPVRGGWSDWRAQARSDYESALQAPPQPSPVDMGAVTRHLQEVLPGDAILTNGAGNFAIWPNKHFRFGRDQRLLAPQSGAMGYGLPAAIAARIAHPERCVVCYAGDGDLQMTLQELATAVQHDAAPIVLVVNNGIYGTIRAHQEQHYPGRVSGTEMTSPDFAALARAYGLHAERVERTEDFPDAFARARAARSGALLDLDVAAEAIAPRATITSLREGALHAKGAL